MPFTMMRALLCAFVGHDYHGWDENALPPRTYRRTARGDATWWCCIRCGAWSRSPARGYALTYTAVREARELGVALDA